jgi:hypothetical protein
MKSTRDRGSKEPETGGRELCGGFGLGAGPDPERGWRRARGEVVEGVSGFRRRMAGFLGNTLLSEWPGSP